MSTTYSVTVKWTSNKYQDIDLDVSQPPLAFKTLLFSLTGVAPDRQKLLFKGIQVKDDDSWSKFKGIQNGANFMMMGTTGELPKAPTNQTVFLEDLKPGQSGISLTSIPTGLTNLGNTCYMNATLQCLRLVPELETILDTPEQTNTSTSSSSNTTNSSFGQNAMHNIAVAYCGLFKQLNQTPFQESIPPLAFMTAFRAGFPQFTELDERTGSFAQQDAEEAWSQLLSALYSSTTNKAVVEQVLGLHFVNVTSPIDETSGDAKVESRSTDLRITCSIDNTTNNIHDAIHLSLNQKLEKTSSTLNRLALFNVKAEIDRLPKFLTVHFTRFFWRTDIKQRVKIRRNVQYGAELDMFKYCTAKLQEKLLTRRNDPTKTHPDLEADPKCNASGYYELCAVLTHIGASSNSGHYIAWTKYGKQWHKYDDDKVSAVPESAVLANSGQSADGHIAYLLLYQSK